MLVLLLRSCSLTSTLVSSCDYSLSCHIQFLSFAFIYLFFFSCSGSRILAVYYGFCTFACASVICFGFVLAFSTSGFGKMASTPQQCPGVAGKVCNHFLLAKD